ncbi:MAG: DUF3892 domain-containing protein [Acidimicrobiales bacterium]|jgi:hypothetical protein
MTNNTNRIVCVTTEHAHRHIVKVGLNTGVDLTVKQVRERIDDGEKFQTHSPSTGENAEVKKDTCRKGDPACTVETIRSAADAIADNNLDNLPVCA